MENKIERARISGVKKEFPGQNLFAIDIYSTVLGACFGTRFLQINGSFPEQGPGILVGNHISGLDPLIIAHAGWRDKRSIIAIAKHTLFDPKLVEDPSVLARTGKDAKDITYRNKFFRHFAARFVKSLGAIPIDRSSGFPREMYRRAEKTLDNGGLLGIFINETRRPARDLLDASPGAAHLARRYKDIPVIPVGLSGTEGSNLWFPRRHMRMRIGQPFTYESLGQNLSIKQFTTFLCSRIAELVDDDYKKCWLEQQALQTPGIITTT